MTIQESAKHSLDGAAGITVLVTWFDFLPDVAAAVSIIWFLIRIWESETVKDLRRRDREDKQ